MATTINNFASATYGYGRDGQDSAVSNVATTSLIEDFAISGSKTALKTEYRPGENIAYQVYIVNNGTQPLYNVSVTDDRGGSNTPLSFISGSAFLNLNGTNSQIIPTTSNPLTFTLTTPLDSGDQATITYMMRVNAGLSEDINSITNTAQITANEGVSTGDEIFVDPAPSATITLEDYAYLTILKDVSESEIVPGQTFSYTITLENSGNLEANGVVVTDTLPNGFTISSITSQTNGVTQTFTPSDYTVDIVTNTLTLPSGSPLSLSVPAANSGVAGVTIITITGSIS